MDPEVQTPIDGVPFTFLVSLFRKIAEIAPRDAKSTRGTRARAKDPPALALFKQWLERLHRDFSPLPEGTVAVCMRLIFPHEDHKRKYDMQEAKLAKALLGCFEPGRKDARFKEWDGEDASGCLGQELRWYLEERDSHHEDYCTPLSIHQIDDLLSELASHSKYTDALIRSRFPQTLKPRADILKALFRHARPEDAAFLVQIILKDLRPLLYPIESNMSYAAALRYFNTKAVTMLSKEDVMRAWDSSGVMLKASRVFSDMDRACEIYQLPVCQRPKLLPVMGTMIEIPMSGKAQKCRQALEFLKGSDAVWAEIKYDGERAQIHVEVQTKGPPKITIYSKSKRDSTRDRMAVHPVICEALGLTSPASKASINKNIILDAEMVAFNEDRIDEFWRIRRLVEKTAVGVRHRSFRKKKVDILTGPRSEDSQASRGMMSDDDEDEERHLGLVFFDILFLDNQSLLFTPYSERRALLERVVRCQPDRAILSKRFLVDMQAPNPRTTLRRIFAEQIADHQEGLMLKASESFYNDFRLPWVKLKKDYIPGFGDTLDMVIIGASWEKERGRELRVFKYPLTEGQEPGEYTFKLHAGLPPPTVMLQVPLLAELFGAGFTKSPGSRHYELRFPRIDKFFRPSERGWRDAVDLRKVHDIARNSVGRDRKDKGVEDEVKRMFKAPCSPGVKCPQNIAAAAEVWVKALRDMDKDMSGSEDEVEPVRSSHAPPSRSPALKRSRALLERSRIAFLPPPPPSPLRPPPPPSRPSTAVHLQKASQTAPHPLTRRAHLPLQSSMNPGASSSFSVKPGPASPASHLVPSKSMEAGVSTSIGKSQCPPSLLGTFVVFEKAPKSSCKACRQLMECLKTKRPVNTLEALLAGCGYGNGPAGIFIKKGAIIVDCESFSGEEEVREYVDAIVAHVQTKKKQTKTVPLSIWRCDRLVEEIEAADWEALNPCHEFV
ncbi:hypothetical protein BKA70DRAFT_1216449 [Coprinopsis sp. MPI-PUGE-AT-0042]|nr:hypothetical protein BKA70DRAFT_1216449 [Coprinopsis sp. MPI-PUGE-AT-0042]